MAELTRATPLLRGVSHRVAFFIACIAGIVLVAKAPGSRAAVAAAVYAASVILLLGISGMYHLPTWSPAAREVLRRIDQSFIFVLIAGTYTPICMLSIPGPLGRGLLIAIWALAAVGIVKSVLWPHAPRMVNAGLYVVVGCLAVPFIPELVGIVPTRNLVLLVGGGVLYIVGAFTYAIRRPDPVPAVFGYHEVFHLLVVVACACHFIAVTDVVSAAAVA